MSISEETSRETAFWDWIIRDNETVWSRRFLAMIGVDLADVARAQSMDFVLGQPFWLHVKAQVAEAANNGLMINERGSFTNPRGETVTVWALGQRIATDGSATSGGTGASGAGAAVGGTAAAGTVVKVRFCSELENEIRFVEEVHRDERVRPTD
jgi:hypothetical protein